MEIQTRPEHIQKADRKRALQILAKSIYRELDTQGYGEQEILALASELIGEVTDRIRGA